MSSLSTKKEKRILTEAFIVTGLGYGDEGKGTITDFLTRYFDCSINVFFNGGAQRAHNVVSPDGRHHTFSQFGSGSFVPGVRTYHSRFSYVNPMNLWNEAEALEKLGVFPRFTIDPQAPIITPYHVAANRIEETIRGILRHGSCGQGIGDLRQDIENQETDLIYAADIISLGSTGRLKELKDRLASIGQRKLQKYKAYVTQYHEWFGRPDIFRSFIDACCDLDFEDVIKEMDFYSHERIVFEGSQGLLLDEEKGEAPHYTWSKTDATNALTLCQEWDRQEITKVGVTRTYDTRHGAGPMEHEGEIALKDQHNEFNEWQGYFRVGALHSAMVKNRVKLSGGIDWLAVTHYDRHKAYLAGFAEAAPIKIVSTGPRFQDKEFWG